MIIDAHGHYTTVPEALGRWRHEQLSADRLPAEPHISDQQLVDSVAASQLRLQRERGTDLTIFSPRASAMDHHRGRGRDNESWARLCNDTVHRVCALFPTSFAFACQLPQSSEGNPAAWGAELRRCVEQLGAVGCLINPDPSGGQWTSPPLTDPFWYPLYDVMTELDVPAMIHASASCTPALHATGALYLNADTAAFMQLVQGDLFTEFPTLRFVLPHGGGAVPFHWGRFRGLGQVLGKPDLASHLLDNVYFDTCVYHQPGIDLLFATLPVRNILFASEMVGAVRGIDPQSGHHFDDTRRYVEVALKDEVNRRMVFADNVLRVYPRLGAAVGSTL